MDSFIVAVLGGDRRLVYAAERFAESGSRVFGYGLSGKARGVIPCETQEEALAHAAAVLLPIPMSRDGRMLFAPALAKPPRMTELFEKAPSSALFFGGMTAAFSEPRLSDYGARADFATLNAIPTAEGALLLALEHLPCMINGSTVGVVGFGKIGKAVASLFRAVGASVTVFARRDEVCTVASHLGYSSASIAELAEHVRDFRCLINTVPAPVIGDEVLSRMRKDTLILELASAPYGVDFTIAQAEGLQVILASGLPGKYAPETAGEAIFHTVSAMMKNQI